MVDPEIDTHVTKCDDICTILDGYTMNADNIRARLDHLEWQEKDFLDSLNEKLARIEKERQGKVGKANALYRKRKAGVEQERAKWLARLEEGEGWKIVKENFLKAMDESKRQRQMEAAGAETVSTGNQNEDQLQNAAENEVGEESSDSQMIAETIEVETAETEATIVSDDIINTTPEDSNVASSIEYAESSDATTVAAGGEGQSEVKIEIDVDEETERIVTGGVWGVISSVFSSRK